MAISDFDIFLSLPDGSLLQHDEVLRPSAQALATLPNSKQRNLPHSQLCVSTVKLPESSQPMLSFRHISDSTQLEFGSEDRGYFSAAAASVRSGLKRLSRTPSFPPSDPTPICLAEVYINGRLAPLHSCALHYRPRRDRAGPPEWVAEGLPSRLVGTRAQHAVHSVAKSAGGKGASRQHRGLRRVATAGSADIQLRGASHHFIDDSSLCRREPIQNFTLVLFEQHALANSGWVPFTKRGSLIAVYHFIVKGTVSALAPSRHHPERTLSELDPEPVPAPVPVVVPTPSPDLAPAAATIDALEKKRHRRRPSSWFSTIKMPKLLTSDGRPHVSSIVNRWKRGSRFSSHSPMSTFDTAFSRWRRERRASRRSESGLGSGTGTGTGRRASGGSSFVRESGRSVVSVSVRDIVVIRHTAAWSSPLPGLTSSSALPGGGGSVDGGIGVQSMTSSLVLTSTTGSVGHDPDRPTSSALEPAGGERAGSGGNGSHSPNRTRDDDSVIKTADTSPSASPPSIQVISSSPAEGAVDPFPESTTIKTLRTTQSWTPPGTASSCPGPFPSRGTLLSVDNSTTTAAASSASASARATLRRVSMDIPRKPVPRSKSIQDLAREEQMHQKRWSGTMVGSGGSTPVGSMSGPGSVAKHPQVVRLTSYP